MRTVGIIAEYNPFHTGHRYHIQKAKECAQAEFAVVVMSPDFVQRGTPAVFDKYTRTEMALLGGADLVLELPVCYASGSAEYFARGAVSVLDALGIVDVLAFGCEAQNQELVNCFCETARLLEEEPPKYRSTLRQLLKEGQTFPQARAAAVKACSGEAAAALLAAPNNVLGTEYCRALGRLHSRISPLPIPRCGSGYDHPLLEGEFCSATALREVLLAKANRSGNSLQEACDAFSALRYIPEECRKLFCQASRMPLWPDDLLPLLYEKFLACAEYEEILDFSPELSDRVRKLRFSCIGNSYKETVSLLKTRQITEARIRRALLHLILGTRTEDLRNYAAHGTVFYARILGFRRSAAPLLHTIRKRSGLPLLSKPSASAALLETTYREDPPRCSLALHMLSQDYYASHLYQAVRSCRYRIPFHSEYQRSPIVL